MEQEYYPDSEFFKSSVISDPYAALGNRRYKLKEYNNDNEGTSNYLKSARYNQQIKDWEGQMLQSILREVSESKDPSKDFLIEYYGSMFKHMNLSHFTEDLDNYIGLPLWLKDPRATSDDVAAFYKTTFGTEINAKKENQKKNDIISKLVTTLAKQEHYTEELIAHIDKHEAKSMKAIVDKILKLESMTIDDRKDFWLKQKLKSLWRSKLRKEAIGWAANELYSAGKGVAFQERFRLPARTYGELNEEYPVLAGIGKGRKHYQAKLAERMENRKAKRKYLSAKQRAVMFEKIASEHQGIARNREQWMNRLYPKENVKMDEDDNSTIAQNIKKEFS